MRQASLLMASLFAVFTSSAQMVEIPLTFKNVLPTQTATFGFTVAAHPNGTIDIDTALGEQEIPSLPPPAGVFIVYSVPPTTDYKWISPRDIRFLEVGTSSLVVYELGITWNGGRLDIEWGALPSTIDSAYITDVITDFPDNFIKKKLEPGQSYSTSNSAITKLKVLVWYNGTTSSINDQRPIGSVYPYPQPNDGTMRLRGAEVDSRVEIFDATGRSRKAISAVSDDSVIDLTDLEVGVYATKIVGPSGMVRTSMIVRR
jgi:hypothetical protein